MVNEPQSSDLEDPLHGLSGLSLFPRTFRDSTNFPKSDSYMKSMALKSPVKLLEQAKVILGGGSELMDSKFASLESYGNKDEPVAAKARNNLQERRPGLGRRRRAQFSMKPNSIQPSVVSEPTLDIDKLEDPEEYFLACEKFENAKKEIARLRGDVVADFVYNPSQTARRRRPGLLGKKFTFKPPQYLSAFSQNDSTMMSSQEKLEQEIFSSDGYGSQSEPTGPNVESQEDELAGSKDNCDLLDELLSSNYENLDGDEALSFLQERLQIKPIDVPKISLPDLHDIGVKFSKPRKPLYDIQNVVKGTSSRAPEKRKQMLESPLSPLASPTPPRSPFASISLLTKRISQSSLSSDPYSALDIDLLPVRDCSTVEPADEVLDRVDSRNSSKSTMMDYDNFTADSMGKPEVEVGDRVHQFDISVKENTVLGVGIDIGSSGAYDDLECYNGSNKTDDRLTDENVSGSTKEIEDRRSTPREMGDHVEDMPQEAVPSSQRAININDSTGPYTDFETYRPNEAEENVEDMTQEAISSMLRDINTEDSTVDKSNTNPHQPDQGHAAVKQHAMGVRSRTSDIGPEQHIEPSQEPSKISLDARNVIKRPSREGRKRKAVSSRKSLAEAGTYWESGLRRSSRIKMRPLEYWKGERFLYGRIHESLATVIGVKYISPGKGDAEPSMRVKSYVSDEYKELVELVALH